MASREVLTYRAMMANGNKPETIRKYFADAGLDLSVVERELSGSPERREQFIRDAGPMTLDAPSAMDKFALGVKDAGAGLTQMAMSAGEGLGWADEGRTADFTDWYNRDTAVDRAAMGDAFSPEHMAGMVVPSLASGGVGMGAKTLGGKMLGGAIAGLPIGAVEFSKSGPWTEEHAQQTLAAGAGGAAGPIISKIAGGMTKYAGNKIRGYYNRLANRFGGERADEIIASITAELQGSGVNLGDVTNDMANRINTAVQAAMRSGTDDPVAAARRALGEEFGLTGEDALTRGQVSRSPVDWRDEYDLSQTAGGAQLKERYANQNRKLIESAEAIGNRVGGRSIDDISTGQETAEQIIRMWDEDAIPVNQAYADARQAMPDATARLDNLDATIEEMISQGERAYSEKAVNAARRLLRTEATTVTDEGRELADIDLGVAEKIRQKIGLWRRNSTDPNERRLFSEMQAALDDDLDAVGTPFVQARNLARQRFEKFGSDLVQSIRDGRFNENTFINSQVLGSSGRVADIENMRELLIAGGGEQTWRNIQGRVYNKLMDKAMQGDSASEFATFSGKQLSKALNKMERSRLNIVFGEEMTDQLYRMARVGQMAISDRPHSGANYSGTGGVVSRLAQGIGGSINRIGNAAMGPINFGVDVYKSGGASRLPQMNPIDYGRIAPASEAAIQAAFRGGVPPWFGGFQRDEEED